MERLGYRGGVLDGTRKGHLDGDQPLLVEKPRSEWVLTSD